MNAMLEPAPLLRPMAVADLSEVMAIESRAYSFPWSHGNFVDSLAAGYLAQVRVAPAAGLLGYFVAMAGADELHLLNLTVAPGWQSRGHARAMLDAIEHHGCALKLGSMWLEVRASNQRARALYRQRGFAEVGLRRGYYPAAASTREDAVVMSIRLQAAHGLE